MDGEATILNKERQMVPLGRSASDIEHRAVRRRCGSEIQMERGCVNLAAVPQPDGSQRELAPVKRHDTPYTLL